MKKIIQLLVFVSSVFVHAQSAGDILFTGFNADGDKDFSIVALKDLNANTIIYFTDSEPNAAGNGNSDSEGVLKWDTGASVINAGTVIVFTDVDSASNLNFGSSVGVLTVVDAGFNIATSGDVVYATYGDPSTNSVTKWIAGIQNNDDGLEANFSATGLSVTSNYVVIDNTASKDGGEYTGTRTGKTVEEYKSLIVDEENWTTMTDNTSMLLPFDDTPFSITTLSVANISKEKIQFTNISGILNTSRGHVIKIINMLGQEVKNSQLQSGFYFVFVNIDGSIVKYKITI